MLKLMDVAVSAFGETREELSNKVNAAAYSMF